MAKNKNTQFNFFQLITDPRVHLFALAYLINLASGNNSTTSTATSTNSNQTSTMATTMTTTAESSHMNHVPQMNINTVGWVVALLVSLSALCLSIKNCRDQAASNPGEQRGLLAGKA